VRTGLGRSRSRGDCGDGDRRERRDEAAHSYSLLTRWTCRAFSMPARKHIFNVLTNIVLTPLSIKVKVHYQHLVVGFAVRNLNYTLDKKGKDRYILRREK
jgi:hypothetical protein